MKVLKRTEFGDPILRNVSRKLTIKDVQSLKIQKLINDMRQTLIKKKMGVGLAAPQVGQGIALSVIAIRPTKHRPKAKKFDLVIINPEITKTYGYRKQMWEGCLSAGKSGLFAKVPRYNQVEISYLDEKGRKHNKQFSGLRAQVLQHEVDHLDGVLFVDHVKDPSTYMTLREYRKRITNKQT